MREGGAHLGRIRRELMRLITPGFDLFEIERAALQKIQSVGAVPNFATVKGPSSDGLGRYGFATCLMVNDEVVHVKPRHYELQLGDLVTIDVGLSWKGWQLDTSDSAIVGRPDDRFVSTGRQALKRAIAMATSGRRIGDISRTIQDILERKGYSAVRAYCGHGIGRALHEEPQIFCYLDPPAGTSPSGDLRRSVGRQIAQTPLIQEGMTLAIEVMANEGRWEVVNDPSGWGARTAGSRSAQFEHTVLVTKNGPEILTL